MSRFGGPAAITAVAAGGVLGSLARYGVGLLWPHSAGEFPWSTVVINVVGSLAIGIVMARVVRGAHPLLRPFVGVGVLGGFTTFSTAMVDARLLVAADRPVAALISVLLTWTAALGGAFVGWRWARSLLGRGGAP